MRYCIYILRWIALAIPGAYFLTLVQGYIQATYPAMMISQAILGAVVYHVDKLIFKGECK